MRGFCRADHDWAGLDGSGVSCCLVRAVRCLARNLVTGVNDLVTVRAYPGGQSNNSRHPTEEPGGFSKCVTRQTEDP